MTKLQKRAIKRVIEILQEGYQEVIGIGITKQTDAELLADIKATTTTGKLGSRLLHRFSEAESWLNDIIGES